MVSVVPAAVPLAKLEEFDAVPQYSFAYDVQDAVTGDSKAQYETRNGDIVQGSYSLIEADGTRRIVEYTADPINGFNAIVSREPAAVVAAVAAPSPLLPLRPVVGVAPAAAPAPSIPAVGPDSDVEVVEARSGPLKTVTREQEIQRQQQREQLRQLQRLQDQQRQQQEQQLRQLQRLQEQQRQQQSSKLQAQQRRPQEEEEEQQQEQQEQQQTPARGVVVGQARSATASGRLVGLPTAAKAIANYPTYPYTAYTTAFTSPLAYATPVAGLTYAVAPALA